jgi:hypothetical protein
MVGRPKLIGRQGLKHSFFAPMNVAVEEAEEKLATSHSEGLGLPEESVFSWVWRRKADPSLRSG